MNPFRFITRRLVDWQIKKPYKQLSKAFKVPSHLTVLERIYLHDLSREKYRIAEIGSYIGASASCFGASISKAADKKIICIDTWNNDAMTEGNRNTWEEFQSNTRHILDHVIPVRGFSTEVVDQVRSIASELDLLFIDGDHSYEGVKADWEAYKNFLTSGSLVVFHDYGWAEGVKRVVHEDVMPQVSSHHALPNMWWGYIS